MLSDPSSFARSARQIFLAGLLLTTGACVGFWLARRTTPLEGAAHPLVNLRQAETRHPDPKPDWAELTKRAPGPFRDAALTSHLEQLAQTDFAAALSLARAEENLRLRQQLTNAVLRVWAESAPEEAFAWTLEHLNQEQRSLALPKLVEGLAAARINPDKVLASLCAKDPVLAPDYGHQFMLVLTDQGRFAEAAQAALTGPVVLQNQWIGTAYQRWGEYQPVLALGTIDSLPTEEARQQARQNLAAGWASAKPVELAQYAGALPPGEWRDTALREAALSWAHTDPIAASEWMNNFDPSSPLDQGRAAIATSPQLIIRRPSDAAAWAESIVDPELREDSLREIVRLWAQKDEAGARSYAASTPALNQDARSRLLASLSGPPAP